MRKICTVLIYHIYKFLWVMTKSRGSSIIFLNSNNEILFVLRDNNKNILYPNMWNLLGGSIENNETPEKAIIREVKEELSLNLENPKLYKITEFPNKTEYTYWQRINITEEELNKSLTEGQRVRWFSKKELEKTKIAFNLNPLVEKFFEEWENKFPNKYF